MTPEATRSKCALHLDVDAEATCERCGRFVCATCIAEPEPVLCTACAVGAGDPFQLKARPFSIGSAIVEGLKLAMLEAGPIVLLALAFSLPEVVLQALMPSNTGTLREVRVSNLYEALVGIIGSQAVAARLIARAEGRRLSVGEALSVSLRTWRRCFAARFRSGLWILGATLLLIVPGVWMFVRLLFVELAVLRAPGDPLEVSKELVRDHWWEMFGVSLAGTLLAYLPVLLVVAVMGVGVEFAHLPSLIAEVFSGWLLTATGSVLTSILLVAYYGLHQTSGRELEPLPFRAPLT